MECGGEWSVEVSGVWGCGGGGGEWSVEVSGVWR